MRITSRTVFAVILAAGLLAACGRAPQPSPLATQADMANPASVFCEEQGGRLEIRTDASGGQAGFCMFADGSECEEWAYFRGECAPAGVITATSTAAEVVVPAAAPPEGWEVYTHPTLGYTFFYPAGSTFESTDTARYTLVVGPLDNDEHWPWFSIAHPDEADYHPPADVDLRVWLVERQRLAGEVIGTRAIAGETAIHTRSDNGPQAYDDDRFYFVNNGQVYEITIMHTGKEDWTVYDIFLDSLHF
jgi:putative hemolysin